jgi:hypothetical protein
MTIEEISAYVESMGGVLTMRPAPGDGTPEVAWGDLFFYYAPDGVVPNGQPFATAVTKDYPGEPSSALAPGEFRVNVDTGRPGQPPADDPTRRDQLMPHPVYAHRGWICVVQPGPSSTAELQNRLRDAHHAAKRRWERRHTT